MNASRTLLCLFVAGVTPAATSAPSPSGVVKHAGPHNYRRVLATLAPGDTLLLEAGVYDRGLPVNNCHGSAEKWTTIQGPETGVAEIRQSQEANCVELRQCSYLALKRLSIVGGGGGDSRCLFGISAQGGLGNSVHHILIEDCVISDWRASQQAVGISTKTPTWDWTIRRNIIRNCGTGLYLGNSNGADPFIRGIIEHNLVINPIGYCMQIKYQKPRPALAGMPSAASSTIIRHNVFIKNDAPSPDGDRPNVLVGGFPDNGPGSRDRYEIYGNFFWNNPRESLLHASGRVSIHDNVFAGCPSPRHAAITARSHDLPLKLVHLYNNTICSAAWGIHIGSAAPEGHAILGNAVFAGEPLFLHRSITRLSGNLTGPVAAAARHLANPDAKLGELDLHPKPGCCEGPPLDLSIFAGESDFDRDFDGRPKGDRRFRGAYAGPGGGAAWRLQADRKPAR
ncbi:MAG: right-handed parallel beta-helix repeat-containing protein [Verrucomicrobiae bacterium]|nr:right-handed parallel beta-helix repeat-containing protein [Verrucomicrobiae bacterium]